MADLDQSTERETLHIQDCRVWAEIYYLDSPTNYREYLPQNNIQLRGTLDDGLIATDSDPRLPSKGTKLPLLGGIVLILISGYLLYLLLDAF